MAEIIFTPQTRLKSEQPNMVLEDIMAMYVKEMRDMYLPNNYEYIINKFIPLFL